MSPPALVAAFAAGALVGALYFPLFRRSVRVLTDDRPGWRFDAAAAARAVLVIGMVGLLVLDGHPLGELGAALAGFFLVRTAAPHVARQPAESEG